MCCLGALGAGRLGLGRKKTKHIQTGTLAANRDTRDEQKLMAAGLPMG